MPKDQYGRYEEYPGQNALAQQQQLASASPQWLAQNGYASGTSQGTTAFGNVANSGFNVQSGGFSPMMAMASGGGTGYGAGKPAQGYGDSHTKAATDYLNKVLKGKELPYDKATQANMLSEQSGMAAAAEGARNKEMGNAAMAGGASYNDPSLAGFRASSMARRQSDNMGAARDIAQNANVQNFGAKQDAAHALATFGLAEEDRRLQSMKDWSNTGYAKSEPTGIGWQAAQQQQQQQGDGGMTSPFPQPTYSQQHSIYGSLIKPSKR